jgi:N-acetylglucosamine kinase-like BadF-type ATPase
MAPLYVGLDAGGSGTRAALASASGELIAIGQGGPSGVLGGAAGQRILRRALAEALAPIVSGARSEPVTVHAGLRGLSIPGRREAALAELQAHFPRQRISISNDALIAQWGGLGGQPGVALLAGTGSIALARHADGREARSGGYGYLVSDEGGAFWLGREAIGASLRALDGRGPPTALAQGLLRATRQENLLDLVGWLYRGHSQVERVAHLAPSVTRAATLNDPVARDIVKRGAHALADLASSAARQLWADAPPNPLHVARCGGVWTAGDVLRKPFDRALRRTLPTGRSSPPRLSPVGGALLLAMRADGVVLENGLVAALVKSFER